MCMASIKHLRTLTGSPLGEIKKALAECNGDMEKAKEWLREQGSAYADKRNARVTSQGQICMKVTNNSQTALLIELNWETDFVAKTDVFKDGIRAFFETLEQSKDISNDFDHIKWDDVKQKFLNKELSRSLDPDLKQMTGSGGLTHVISKTRENCNIGQILRMDVSGIP